MPETLTESFCERCGTRYTFESAAPKGKRLGKIKVLSKGFVNFVSNDDRSLDEAFAEARSDEQREQTSQQLDAFHQTFQFCMSCRQYTCANCWNDVESRCLSCAPLFGSDTLGGAFPAALDPLARLGLGQPTPEIHAANGHQNGDAELPALGEPATDSAWPTADRAKDGGAEVPWPELAALSAVAGEGGEPSADAGAPETIEPEALGPETAESEAAASADDAQAQAVASEAVGPGMAAWEAARSAFEDQPEAAAPEAISADAVDEDVALAVAEAERVRQAAAEAELARQAAAEAEAELERQRQAAEAEAERQRQAADAEAEREREVAAAAEEAAEQQRQVALAAAEAERERMAAQAKAADLEAAEAVSAAETKAERQAAVEAEALRQRQAVEAELQREREAAAEADRQRQAAEAAELQRQAAEATEADRQRQAAEAAELQRQAAEADRQRQATEAAERQRQAETLAAAAALQQAPPPPANRDDRVGAPIWQIVAPETPPTQEPGPLDLPPAVLSPQPPLPASPTAANGGAQITNGGAAALNGAPQPPPAGASEWPSPATTPPPQWPMPRAVTAPQWPVGQGTARGANDDLWAASSQDVLSKAGQGVQACTSCGLPLSASARFCRRCGTQQH